MNLKNTKKVILIMIGLLLFINSPTFGKESTDCKVCFTSAEEFDMMINMTYELINYIKTIGKEGDYIGKYINPNRYEGTKFNPPSKLKKATNLVLKSESLITTTALLFGPPKNLGVTNYLHGFILLFKNKVFPRDYKKTLDLESRISDKIYELGLGGGYYQKINSTNIKDIEKILKRYQAKGLLLSYSIDKDITYGNIAHQANEIVSGLKRFLSIKSVKQFSKLNGNLTLNINPQKMLNMKGAYECSNECNETKEKALEEIKEISETLKGGTSRSWNTINRSIKKFREEIAGIKTKNLFDNTIKVNGSKGLVKTIKDLGEANRNEEKKIKSDKALSDQITDIQEKTLPGIDTKAIITNSLLETIGQHREDLKYAIVTETKTSNYYFEKLSKTINRDIEIIKDLKKNLKDAANLQCSK